MNNLTLGSLFDGSGGFPLGGILSRITPVWSSEIEPFPIRVTTKRLPQVIHLGDVSEVNGGGIEPVDIITFGSPCQDLSVAGKRAGLENGERSSLFYQAIRIIKEMRRETNGKYPRYIVWENVPGAFSSNGGEDFKSVLESVCSVKDANVHIPMPEKGRWTNSGEIVGENYSVAWRVLDAQYFGVPQRRRRIYLVADFGSERAGEILFESEGVPWHTPPCFGAGQGIACGAEESVGKTSSGVVLNDQGGNRIDITKGVACTLRAEAHHPPCIMESAGFCTEHSARAKGIGYEEERSPTLRAGTVPAAIALENHPADSRIRISDDGKVQTLASRMGTGGNNVPLLMKIRCGCEGGGKGALIQENKSATISCNNDQTLFEPCLWDGSNVAPTLTKQNAGGNQRMPDKDNFNCVIQPSFGICSKDSNAMKSKNPKSGVYEATTSRTLDGNGGNPSCNQGGIAVVEEKPISEFHINQRGEAIDLKGKSGALMAAHSDQMQTFVLQGSMIGRKGENGPQGSGIGEDVCFTLDATDRHAVYCMTTGSFTDVAEERSPALVARDFKSPNVVNEPVYGIGRDTFNQGTNAKFKPSFEVEKEPPLMAKGPGAVIKAEPEYTVRRLTPTECARLQGFPDWWCSSLGTDNPTEEEIVFWKDVFETHRKLTSPSAKPKTEKQIAKWLKNPYSDSAEYKMWGNGVALPCVVFVLSAIVAQRGKTA